MCRLGGEFAGILRIEIPAEKKSALLAALQNFRERTANRRARRPAGGNFDAGPADETGNRRQRPSGHRPRNHQRARARGVNVEEFSSEVVSAPMSGETLFKASARLQLPERLRPRRAEKRFGKNRRRFAGGCFVRRTGQSVSLGCPSGFASHRQNMRHLLQPRVLNLAASPPWFRRWLVIPAVALAEPPAPVWYLEATDFPLRHCPLGFCLRVAHAIHRSAGLCFKLEPGPFIAAT
jgi:hypothetical protein